MSVLIATTDSQLAHRCKDALAVCGQHWTRIACQTGAEAALDQTPQSLMLLDIGSGAIAPPLGFCLLVAYRWPRARIAVLLGNGLQADGTLMALCPSVVAYLPRRVTEDDLAAIASHHAAPAARCPAPTHPAFHMRH